MCNVLSIGETKYIGKATSEGKKKDGWLENLHVFWQLESVGRFFKFFTSKLKKKRSRRRFFGVGRVTGDKQIFFLGLIVYFFLGSCQPNCKYDNKTTQPNQTSR